MEPNTQAAGGGDVIIDYRSFLTWMATSVVIYLLLSGLAVLVLPFGTYVQYSIIVHSVVGLVATAPIGVAVCLHWKRRKASIVPPYDRIALAALVLLILGLSTGLFVAAQAMFGSEVGQLANLAHMLLGIALGVLIIVHLLPILARYRSAAPTVRRPARKRFVATGAALVLTLFLATSWLASGVESTVPFQAFGDDYGWPYGEDHPFWPSRADLARPPWQENFLAGLAAELDAEGLEAFRAALDAPRSAGIRDTSRTLVEQLEIVPAVAERIDELAARAAREQRETGALRPEALTGSAGCGSGGCHEAIYAEWQASAHGYSAIDVVFVRVQKLLAESKGPAETRSCAGCHDPVALFSGARHAEAPMGEDMVTYEGNSCLVCHGIVETDTAGNGGFVLGVPGRYLYERAEGGLGEMLGKFLIRSYPDQHIAEYSRPLYRSSDFCAACHKQVPPPGEATVAGIAQEQNEYDSWRSSDWYHGEGDPKTIDCRECHMPLVASDDPARGSEWDSYRSADDGKHRSHRMLASNMYIPMTMDLPGGEEQARQTIAWMRGEIDVPEIEHKWVTGPVVKLDILAPDRIRPGELVNIKLQLHNNKTGHDFPAGPLDVLESWIELTVDDNLGNRLLELGTENSVAPSIDAPVVYKADWYDRQGLPVDRHNLWDVVGASYRRTIRSGDADIVDVPFRCPGIARPRLSQSASEEGPGERTSDVVFSIRNPELTELRVTARLLFRKANPEFIAKVYDLEPLAEAPVIELVSATHTIRVSAD